MTPEELFYSFPEPVPAMCWKLRDLVLEEAPGVLEEVRPRWKLLGFELDSSSSGAVDTAVPGTYFCGVAPQRDHARLLFEFGIELEDPDRRLLGHGTQVRFLKFETLESIDERIVRRFIRLAVRNRQDTLSKG